MTLKMDAEKFLQRHIPSTRKIYCNRTLNLKSIKAIGYDMDYTLIHYRVEEWERSAYTFLKQQFLNQGWPVQNLDFNPKMVCRGVVIDKERGNLIKPNRFGFVKHAYHGSKVLSFEEQRRTYSRTIIDLAEKRWIFLNTLFSLSEGCMYAQLVDLFDNRQIPDVLGYSELYERVSRVMEAAHMEGRLKAEIISHPEKFVILDEDVVLTLLDQYYSGKKLLLITNSEWHYSQAMMDYSFNRFLPEGMTWKHLFELIIVGARKPQFFTTQLPFFEVVTEEGLLKPSTGQLQRGISYLGGSASQVEKYLGLSGDEILYVGDHMFGDVHVTKNVLRWRTALILRELEEEITAIESFQGHEVELTKQMELKEKLEALQCQLRLIQQRKIKKYGAPIDISETEIEESLQQLKTDIDSIDQQTSILAKSSSELNNPRWGLLMRAGNDKSYLAYQMERYADIYTSRVSNLYMATPFAYFRSSKGSLPHDLLRVPSAES